jgi:hypothetical protein
MNFKNLTKITAIAALLFANVSMLATQPLYLHIQNDTNYDFDLSQSIGGGDKQLGILKAHSYIGVDSPEWSRDSIFGPLSYFDFARNGIKGLSLSAGVTTDPSSSKQKLMATLSPANLTRQIAHSEVEDSISSDNQFSISATIKGELSDNFKDSSIQAEINAPIR